MLAHTLLALASSSPRTHVPEGSGLRASVLHHVRVRAMLVLVRCVPAKSHTMPRSLAFSSDSASRQRLSKMLSGAQRVDTLKPITGSAPVPAG